MADLAAALADSLSRTGVRTAAGPCRYLFHQQGSDLRGHQVPDHAHPFWQLELVESGTVAVVVERERFLLGAGTGMLIPSGCLHRLDYLAGETRYRSVKFACAARSGARPLLLVAAPGAVALATALAALLDGPAPLAPGREAIGHLLAAVVALHMPTRPASAALGDPLVAQITAVAQRNPGEALTVGALAHALDRSPGQIAARFRAAAGEPLKRWLDRHRAAHAAEVLAYSDQSLTAIAELLGFPDLFAFSRFFKRVTGASPRSFRERLRRPEGGKTPSPRAPEGR